MLARQLHGIRALVFDWDGVFNDGWKDAQGGSPFSEVDSMGAVSYTHLTLPTSDLV